ncbi:DUF4129 domain-containing transglutaminase family protein [Urbifossiella limnaea]|uniref:Protein-glutamine gamma-glutamyltransferase n=1 Tax=Urbifossiella limnaea TaxID=2528023 RepID=A0A517XVQ7_9BACT|nr:transglutaminase domain-containing protein [Urbifossiella limnaea]QDU21576.1 Protein-glutamine gamma-glutamyltransferase [Urbifossiella limnaea]
MTADPAFRLSTFLTLGLACAALGAAEAQLLPEVAAFATAVVVTLAVVYRLDGRAEVLSPQAATNLGLGLALAGAGWAGVRIVRETRAGDFVAVGWGVFVVLLLTPILMVLSVSFVLRRDKDVGVYWYLHAIGLGVVVLAAAIARRPWEVAALVAYAAAAVWGLARFALARGGAAPAAGRRAGLMRAAGWFTLAVMVATPVFAVTPPAPVEIEKFELAAARIEVGFSPDQGVDLTRTGELTSVQAVIFHVDVDENGKPKIDLPQELRWRGRLLAHYAHGSWRREAIFRMPQVVDLAVQKEDWTPPDLGPGGYRIRYTVPASLRSEFLAEPVVWRPGRTVPLANVYEGQPPRPWIPLADGSFFRQIGRPDQRRTLEYVQHTAPLPDPDLGVGFLRTGTLDPELTKNPVPAVRAFTNQLLPRLIREGKLSADAGTLNPVNNRLADENHEAVARAFTAFLSEAPEYTYTLNLTRPRPDLDPVEEFLEHSKTGHCERYASALVLMLRAQGIPAALAVGFKGHEHLGEGRYVIPQDHAHAWAVALVSRPDAGGGRVWHWLSLDPSPGEGISTLAAAGEKVSGWAWVWDRLLDATPEERLEAIGDLASNPIVQGVVATIAVLAAAAWGVRLLRRARVAAGARNPWLDPLYAVLAPHGFTPAADETPREFAARVSAALGGHPAAAIPPAWVERYYAQRFGGATVTPPRTVDLDALRAAMTELSPGGTR